MFDELVTLEQPEETEVSVVMGKLVKGHIRIENQTRVRQLVLRERM